MFPGAVRESLSQIHPRCRCHQREWPEKAELAPEQRLFISDEATGESKIFELSNYPSQKWLAAACCEIQAHDRGTVG